MSEPFFLNAKRLILIFRIQIVLATNQVYQLDGAVLDRMNELLEIPLPGLPEREQMVKQYLLSHVIEPTQKSNQRVTLDPSVIGEFNEITTSLAEMTEGMSGRELEKMCGNIYVSTYLWYISYLQNSNKVRILSFKLPL